MAYQPHRYTRTRDLYDDFVHVLSQVDQLLLLNVFPAGEEPIAAADSRSLCRTIRKLGKKDPILVPDINDLPHLLANIITDNDLVITQGAGNIGTVVKTLADFKLDTRKMEKVVLCV
jgi:UDP-N-acetylmuramate--alanine ligase